MFTGCSAPHDINYVPSIASLSEDEMLFVKYTACHNGCTKGRVKFKNGVASYRGRSLSLTKAEISDLDLYFSSVENIDQQEYFCSLEIKISFKQKKSIWSQKNREERIFPCDFSSDDDTISMEMLILHLEDTPGGTPFWRLTSEEQNERLTIELD